MSRKKKKKTKLEGAMEWVAGVILLFVLPLPFFKMSADVMICTPENTEERTLVIQESYFRTIDWLKGRSSRFFLRSTDGDLYTMNEYIARTWHDGFFSEPGTELAVSLLYDDGRRMKDPETGAYASAYIVSASHGDRVIFTLDTENGYRHTNKIIPLVIGIVLAIPFWGLLLLGIVIGIGYLIELMIKRIKHQTEAKKS